MNNTPEAVANRFIRHLQRTGLVFGPHITEDPERLLALLEALQTDSNTLLKALFLLAESQRLIVFTTSTPDAMAHDKWWENNRYIPNPHPPRLPKNAVRGPRVQKKSKKKVRNGSTRTMPIVAAKQPVTKTLLLSQDFAPVSSPSVEIAADLGKYLTLALNALRERAKSANNGWMNIGTLNPAEIIHSTMPDLSGRQVRQLVQLLINGSYLLVCEMGCGHVRPYPAEVTEW